MTTSSAPAKVYLFGEHAVVYGEPAVPCAIERRAQVTVDRREDNQIRVQAKDLTLDGFTVTWGGSTERRPDVDVPTSLVEAAMGYIEGAVDQALDAAGAEDVGFDVTIESDIPLGAGIGSSAAVVTAGIDAATRELGVELDPKTIADRAYTVEYDVQDGEASRADTFCSAMGGAVRVQGDDCRRLRDVPQIPFVIGYDGNTGNTGELVASVRGLKTEYEFADDTVGAIGDIVRAGESALKNERVEEIGRLMNFNHGLLSALGVSARSLDTMVWAAREAGAYGAKLTGAGGGGCIVALDHSEQTRTALEYTPGCETAFRAELDTEGVRAER